MNQPRPAHESMKTCAYCGRENSRHRRYCRKCGTEFPIVAQPPPLPDFPMADDIQDTPAELAPTAAASPPGSGPQTDAYNLDAVY